MSGPSLTEQTVVSAAWVGAMAVLAKAINLCAILTMAWLFDEEDFGAVALAIAVTNVAAALQKLGLREVLISRSKRLDLWTTPALSMALAAGLGTALILVLVARPLGNALEAPDLPGLVSVIAASVPFAAFGFVAQAHLNARMQFRGVALLHAGLVLFTSLTTIALAIGGWGAYAYIVPLAAMTVLRSAGLWALARPQVRWRVEARRWRYLFSSSFWMFGAAALEVFIAYGDYLALGVFHDTATVGLYFFAFNLSRQLNELVGQNLAVVVHPALNILQDDRGRQIRSFNRVVRNALYIVLPLYAVQAAVAPPLFELLFGDRWDAAILPFQILCLGTGLWSISALSRVLIQAQRRFRFHFLWSAGLTVSFLVTVATAAAHGGVDTVAAAVAIYFSVVGPLSGYWAIRTGGGTATDLLGASWRPVAMTCAALLLTIIVTRAILPVSERGLDALVLTPLTMGLAYVALFATFEPEVYRVARARLQARLGRLGRLGRR